MTREEMLEAVTAALRQEQGAEGFTGTELMEALGHRTPDATRRALRELLTAGTIEVVQLRRVRIDGRPVTMPGYRFRG